MIRNIFPFVLLTLWLLPSAALLFDCGCWFFMAEQCTRIDWMSDDKFRVVVTVAWTITLPLIIVAFGAIFY